MANQDAAFGFRPARHLTGGQIRAEEANIANNYDTAIYTGQVVEAVTAGGVEAATVGDVQQAGVFGGVYYTDPTTSKPTWKAYYPASTAAADIENKNDMLNLWNKQVEWENRLDRVSPIGTVAHDSKPETNLFEIVLTATYQDVNSDDLTYSWEHLSSWDNADDRNSFDTPISFTPNNSSSKVECQVVAGIHEFQVTVTDTYGEGTTEVVTIVVGDEERENFIFKHKNLRSEDITKMLDNSYKSYYTNPSWILKYIYYKIKNTYENLHHGLFRFSR